MDESTAGGNWEAAIAELLDELSAVQDELLAALTAKRDLIVAGDLEQLDQVQRHEQQLGERLEACHRRRAELLQQAARNGLPGDSIAELASALPNADRQTQQRVQQASARTRILRHHSLTNWVLAQRSLLHMSQLLEILATGGKTKPTYSKEESPLARGNLVDRAA